MDWAASFIGLVASYLIGRHNKYTKYGFLLFALNSGLCIVINYKAGLMGMATGSLCYMILELRGWLHHHKAGK